MYTNTPKTYNCFLCSHFELWEFNFIPQTQVDLNYMITIAFLWLQQNQDVNTQGSDFKKKNSQICIAEGKRRK